MNLRRFENVKRLDEPKENEMLKDGILNNQLVDAVNDKKIINPTDLR